MRTASSSPSPGAFAVPQQRRTREPAAHGRDLSHSTLSLLTAYIALSRGPPARQRRALENPRRPWQRPLHPGTGCMYDDRISCGPLCRHRAGCRMHDGADAVRAALREWARRVVPAPNHLKSDTEK